jgi:hypothetical protein
VLTIARMRADAEEVYGQRIGDILPATDRIQGGFARDDGASVRKVGCSILFADVMMVGMDCACFHLGRTQDGVLYCVNMCNGLAARWLEM